MDLNFCLALHKAGRLMHEFLNETLNSSGLDIRAEHWYVMKSLFYNHRMTQQELVTIHYRDKTYITRVIDFLEDRKLVRRLTCRNDRRNNIIKLTQEGKSVITAYNETMNKTIETAVLKTMNEAEAASCMTLTSVLTEQIRLLVSGK